jgi:hypothetical protein
MIRTTYRGRAIKILAAKGKPGHVRTFINGQILSHAWDGTDAQALDWFRQIIDRLDAKGGPGHNPAYARPWWYEPGTYVINGNGCPVTPDGGTCICGGCLRRPEGNLPGGSFNEAAGR